ncbi:hypothetical protein DFH09DRAFT_1073795 [Mycena vulgaris]|nr:hypothetical protein DFH09DRAFT_1073795 [Mycena vulgaris]
MTLIKIQSTDPRINYSQGWSSTPGPKGMERTTSTYGESFNLNFNASAGSTIAVYGGVHPTSTNTSLVPRSVYVVDDKDRVVFVAPFVSVSTPVLPFYNSTLLTTGTHTLFGSMLSDNPYYLDFILIEDPSAAILPASSPSATSAAATTATNQASSNAKLPLLVGTSLGAFVLLLSIILAAVLLRQRSRRESQPPRDSGESGLSPYAEIARSDSGSVRKGQEHPPTDGTHTARVSISTDAVVGSDGVVRLGTGQSIDAGLLPPAYSG